MDSKHVLVILGGPFLPEGTDASQFFGDRVDRAVELINQESQKPSRPTVVVTSGGRSNPADAQSRAEQIRDLMVMKIELDNIGPKCAVCSLIMEQRCYNTFEAAKGLKQLIKRKHIELGALTVVTNDFHVPRTELIFNRVFNTLTVRYLSVSTVGVEEAELVKRVAAEKALISGWLPNAFMKYASPSVGPVKEHVWPEPMKLGKSKFSR